MSGPRAAGLLAIRWSAGAVEDLEAILDWLDSTAGGESALFERDLLATVEPLGRYPLMGRVPRDLDWQRAGFHDLRELLVGEHRVGYVVEARFVEVVYLVHGRRRFPPVR
jgi:plasmid stabilization system protein ParE